MSDFDLIKHIPVSSESQPRDILFVKPANKTVAQLIARVRANIVKRTEAEHIKKPSPTEKRQACSPRMSSKVKLIRVENPKCPNIAKYHRITSSAADKPWRRKTFSALNSTLLATTRTSASENEYHARCSLNHNAKSVGNGDFKPMLQTKLEETTSMEVSVPEHVLIPKKVHTEHEEPSDLLNVPILQGPLTETQLAKYKNRIPTSQAEQFSRYKIPRNTAGTKTSRINETVSSILKKHIAEPICLPQPVKAPIAKPSDTYKLTLKLKPIPRTKATLTKNKKSSFTAEMKKRKEFLYIDDDDYIRDHEIITNRRILMEKRFMSW